jgi:hypothetical protein
MSARGDITMKSAIKLNSQESNHEITINVPVVYIERYIMVLRRARSIARGIGRGFWKSETFLGPKKSQKSPPLPMNC